MARDGLGGEEMAMFKRMFYTCVDWLVENFTLWELVWMLVVLVCAGTAFALGIYNLV